MTHQTIFLSALLTFSLCFGCSRTGDPPNSENINPPAQSYTGDRVEVDYAEGFSITYHNGYKHLRILNPYQDRTDTLNYYLVQRGGRTLLPEQVAIEGEVIEIPVRSMIVTSTTHLGLTDMLEANHIVTGVTEPEYVYTPAIREGMEQGRITPFNGSEFNRELALSMSPDLVMVSGGQSSQVGRFDLLSESGIGVIINSEWLERTPLGKAEWVKMLGALLNKEALANRRFREVESRYLELKEMVSGVSSRPLVINNIPYRGAWFASGGESFTSQYLKDAGADYEWYDNPSTGGLRLDFEEVYEVGLRADIWLNPGSARSKEEMLAIDSRFNDFRPFRNGEVYNNNRRLSASGGNDFWESGSVHPEIVLADLIRIFHPSLLPDHTLYYHRRIQ